jgi:hypothetical protein
MKTTSNSYLPFLAKSIAELIDQWRGEISERKNFRPRLAPNKVEAYLRKAEDNGVPATLVGLTVLMCEWVFRVRRITEKDIEQLLYEMEGGFCKPRDKILTLLQARLLIKSCEKDLRKQLKNNSYPIALGFDTTRGPHPRWGLSPADRGREKKRMPPKPIVPRKTGRPPILGPIMAGVIVEALSKETTSKGKNRPNLGRELCALLLKREVQRQELTKWRKLISEIPYGEQNLRHYLKEQVQDAYYQTFERQKYAISPQEFLGKCKTEPKSALKWLASEDILTTVYSAKWGGVKNPLNRQTETR